MVPIPVIGIFVPVGKVTVLEENEWIEWNMEELVQTWWVDPVSKIQMLGLRVDDEGERERIPVKLEMDC